MEQEQDRIKSIDFRIYLGMLFFRWKIIVLCFLLALLAGVAYLLIAEKKYAASCSIMMYRDPDTMISKGNPWGAYNTHIYLLRSTKVLDRVVDALFEEWGKKMGSRKRMYLPVAVRKGKALSPTLDISVISPHAEYGRAFLSKLLEEHKIEWKDMQRIRINDSTQTLNKELENLDERITQAEQELHQFERQNDINRRRMRIDQESAYISTLINTEKKLKTELMMMEHSYPELKDENIGVIAEVSRLNAEAADPGSTTEASDPNASATDGSALPDDSGSSRFRAVDEVGWQDLRFEIATLESDKNDLLKNLLPDHPRVKAIEKRIEKLNRKLRLTAELHIARVRDRQKALQINLESIEDAIFKWDATYEAARSVEIQLKRTASVLAGYEKNYQALYQRLHQMRASEELKVERYRVVREVNGNDTPVSPDAAKIIMLAIGVGLAGGIGLALGLQFVDNKVQTVHDVEDELGVRFIGGIPYWAHSGLEKAIRPIVTEEHSSGAIEAYRALRTRLLSELDASHEKIVLVTSADSREGKTLTCLNLAIMTAHMGKKVLLVDMDLRRGRLHRSLGLSRGPGVTDMLREGSSLKNAILPTRIENLDLVPTGHTMDDAAEVLQTVDMISLFGELQDEYDYIFVDTSPVLRVTDCIIVASQGVGVVVYVARVNHTAKPLIRYSLDLLKEANVLGLIMNSIEMHKISSLYYAYQYPNYAYYSNAYSYGYNYYNYGEGTSGLKTKRRGRLFSAGRTLKKWFRRTFFPV